jgi:glutamine synthetase
LVTGQTGNGSLLGELERRNAASAHLLIADLAGVLRQRRFGRAELARFLADPRFVNVLPQWDAAEKVFGAGPFEGEAVTLDRDSLRPHPFEAEAATLFVDYAGPSAALSPRPLVKALVEQAAAAGYGVQAAFEFEFIVLRESAESLRDKSLEALQLFALDNRCWSALTAATESELVSELDATLRRGGIEAYALGFELGPGCFEATLAHKDALAAADEALLFRTFTKAFFRRRGLTASFMAQLGLRFPGLSGHLHLSLTDRASGRNLFAVGEGRQPNAALAAFVAGMVRLLPEALPFSAHTCNAYRRMSPGNWAPRTATWAVENYAAAVRVVPGTAESCRIEFRIPGADTHPHLALAFALGAGLWGLRTGATLPSPLVGGGPDETPADAPGLPHDLHEATARLAASERAPGVWGERFVEHFVTVCRHESDSLRRAVSREELLRYLEM